MFNIFDKDKYSRCFQCWSWLFTLMFCFGNSDKVLYMCEPLLCVTKTYTYKKKNKLYDKTNPRKISNRVKGRANKVHKLLHQFSFYLPFPVLFFFSPPRSHPFSSMFLSFFLLLLLTHIFSPILSRDYLIIQNQKYGTKKHG